MHVHSLSSMTTIGSHALVQCYLALVPMTLSAHRFCSCAIISRQASIGEREVPLGGMNVAGFETRRNPVPMMIGAILIDRFGNSFQSIQSINEALRNQS